jgi:hypothetical protein
MHLEFLLEEPSAEVVIKNLISKMIRGKHSYKLITHQGKDDLLKKLPGKLMSYHEWIDPDFRIIVLVDRDEDDCYELKENLERLCREAGFHTKTHPYRQQFIILNRIVIEELESWFIGDSEAIRNAFPRINPRAFERPPFRNPDNINGTWEALALVLKKAGYMKAGYKKIESADKISRHMNPLRNRSHSFHVFWDGLSEIIK